MAAEPSFRDARIRRHLTARRPPWILTPEARVEVVYYLACAAIVCLLVFGGVYARLCGALLLAVGAVPGWRFVKVKLAAFMRPRIERQIAADLTADLPTLARQDTPASAE